MEIRHRVKRHDSKENAEEESTSDDSFVEVSSPENEGIQETESLKFPIHVLEHRIRSFTQTTVPHDLGRLRTHREKIAQMHSNGDWAKLNSEQINANRTVQQLKMHLRALDDLRHQVDPRDVSKFDQRTTNIRQQILSSIQDYGMITASLKATGSKVGQPSGAGDEEETHSLNDDDGDSDQQGFDELLTISDKSALIPQQEPAVQSWEELKTELMELNELVRVLQSEVKGHRQAVAKVEDNINQANLHVQDASLNVQTASRLQLYALPVGGALLGGVVGGVVGGPIGAFAGLKVGAITAAAGGVTGAIGGALVGLKAKTFRRWRED